MNTSAAEYRQGTESRGYIAAAISGAVELASETVDILEALQEEFMDMLKECIEYEKTNPSTSASAPDGMILPLRRETADGRTKSA